MLTNCYYSTFNGTVVIEDVFLVFFLYVVEAIVPY